MAAKTFVDYRTSGPPFRSSATKFFRAGMIIRGRLLASIRRFLWNWDGAETEIMSRTTDETGYTQPTLKQLLEARGTSMGGYHLNPVSAWIVRRNGEVLAKPENFR